MNKIYKVIWSKARNCYVVVSELAKRNGKCKAAKTDNENEGNLLSEMSGATSLHKAAVALLLAGMIGMPGVSEAGQVKIGTYATTESPGTVSTDDTNIIAIGTDLNVSGKSAIDIGVNSKVNGEKSIGVGSSLQVTGTQSIGIGDNARVYTNSSIAIGVGQPGIGRWAINVSGKYIDQTLDSADQGGNSIAIGTGAMVFTYGDVMAEGYYANTKNSVAIGHNAHTHASNAFAIGVGTDATAERSFAIGTGSTENSANHSGTRSSGQGSIAFGDQARTFSSEGLKSNHSRGLDLNANDSVAVGTKSWAMAQNAIALGGNLSYTYDGDDNDKSLTLKTMYGQYEGSDRGAQVGDGADSGIAIGGAYGTITKRTETQAAGINIEIPAAATYGKRGIAIGTGALVESKTDSNALNDIMNSEGYITAKEAYESAEAEFTAASVAKANLESELVALDAAGVDHNDPRYAEIINELTKVGGINAQYADAQQHLNDAETQWNHQLALIDAISKDSSERSSDAIAIGTKANATMNDTIAIGKNAHTGNLAARSFAIGLDAETGELAAASIAFGANTKTGKNAAGSLAIGIKSETGDNAVDGIAIGVSNTANGAKSIAIGSRNIANGDRAIVIGIDSQVDVNRSIALGSNSRTYNNSTVQYGLNKEYSTTADDRAGAVANIIGYDMGTGKSYAGSDRYTPTWMSTAGSLSIGGGVNKEGELVTRRITNVAAGASDTEAVNVAQLKRAIDQTVMTSDNRNVGIGQAKERGLEIISPYYETTDVGETVKAISFMNRYETIDKYKDALANDLYGKLDGGTEATPSEASLKGQLKRISDELTSLTNKKDTLDREKAALEDKRRKYQERLSLKPTDAGYDPNYYTDHPEEIFTDNDVKDLVAKTVELKLVTNEIGVKETEKTSKEAEIDDKISEIDNATTTFNNYANLSQTRAQAIGQKSTAVGYNTKVTGTNSYAIGNENFVGKNETDSDGNLKQDATTKYVYAIGSQNEIGKNNGGSEYVNVFGYGNTAEKLKDSTIIGKNNQIAATDKDNVFVLGNNITSVESNSVFLGSNSAYVATTTATTKGTDNYTSAKINGITYDFAGGSDVAGVVSVGDVGKERRIQNVAPGLISAASTDAVNGSQLYAVINSGWKVGDNDSTAQATIASTRQVNYINGNGTTSKVTQVKDPADANKVIGANIQYDVNTSTITVATDGKVTAKTPDTATTSYFATATTVQNAINNSGWNVTSSAKGGTASNSTTKLVNPGSTVEYVAGSGIKITQEQDGTKTKFTFEADASSGGSGSGSNITDESNKIIKQVTTDKRSTNAYVDSDGLWTVTTPYIDIHGTADEAGEEQRHWSRAMAERAVAIGRDSKVDEIANDGLAVGTENMVSSQKGLAIGAKNTVGLNADEGMAIGSGNTVTGKQSQAIGSGNTVTGVQSIAIGTGHRVTGSRSGAIGDPAIVTGDYAFSVGNNNQVNGDKNIVIGNDSKITNNAVSGTFVMGNDVTISSAEAKNSVFLGSNTAYVPEGATTAGMSDYSSATISGKTYNFAGGKPAGVVSVGDVGKERRIQNVAAGKVSPESTDAVNGSQLYHAMNDTAQAVTQDVTGMMHQQEGRLRKGIAGAAALAALHPLEFDPDDKLSFAAGVGSYRGETAAAIGAFYRADEKTMFSIGGSMGNGENVVNAGVSFSLDRTPRKTSSRAAMAREIVELREQVAQLTAIVNQLAGGQLPVAPVMYPNTPENAWAYEYLENLQKQGTIVGYTGRELSRAEFAAALDRAAASGVTLDERIVNEFASELSRVNIAYVNGKGNDEGKIFARPRVTSAKAK